jgi:hypothetical protein
MAINKGEMFADKDVYVDYPFEEVMYRWDHLAENIYVKFYGESEKSEPIPHDNNLFNEALLSGHEISKEEYQNGR